MTDRWKVTVDHHACVRTGLCVATAPGEFEFDGNGQSSATAETLPSSPTVLEAAESCPLEAISITDADSGKPVFPPS